MGITPLFFNFFFPFLSCLERSYFENAWKCGGVDLTLSTDGMIMFPATGVFADLGPMGVSIFFLTWVSHYCEIGHCPYPCFHQ